MIRPLSLSFTALCVFTFLCCKVQAQELVPIIQLSAEETARASKIAQAVKDARERDFKAKRAWDAFHESYQSAHPDLPNVRFTSDFRLALALPYSVPQGHQVTALELTAGEQGQLKALHKAMTDSEQSLRQVQKDWSEYQYQLAANHVPSDGSGVLVRLPDGKQATIPAPWGSGLAFTPD